MSTATGKRGRVAKAMKSSPPPPPPPSASHPQPPLPPSSMGVSHGSSGLTLAGSTGMGCTISPNLPMTGTTTSTTPQGQGPVSNPGDNLSNNNNNSGNNNNNNGNTKDGSSPSPPSPIYPKLYIKQSVSPTSSPPGSSQHSSSLGDGSPSHISTGYGSIGGHSQGQLSPSSANVMDHHNYGSVTSATASFPWHAPLSDFHNGCVQRSSPMTYSPYKNGSCYTQSYAANPYYTNMSDYFTPNHPHNQHHFPHHQMTNPYAISGSHTQHNFVNRTPTECMDSYGATEKYQVL